MTVIVTKQNTDGTSDEVGMRNRYLTSHYKTLRGLIRYGLPEKPGKYRIEIFANIYQEPTRVVYHTKH